MVRRRTAARKKTTAYHALGAAPAKHNGAWVILVLGGLVLVNLYVFVWDKKSSIGAIQQRARDAHGPVGPVMNLPSQPLGTTTPSPKPKAPEITPVAAPIGPPTAIEGKVPKSDTLGKLLKHNGLTAAEADEVIRSLSPVLDFRTIRAGESFRIERGADGRVKRFDLELAKGHRVRAERQASGEMIGSADTSANSPR